MPAPDLFIHPDQAPRLGSRGTMRIREDSLYTNHKGQEKKEIHKRTEKALVKLESILAKVLEQEEAILYVAWGQAPLSAVEQLTFGWYSYYVSRTVLVFTNRRLLHFLVTRDGTWKSSLRSLRWGDLAEAKVKGWLFNPALELRYRNRKKEKYWGLRRDDAKKINVLLAALLPASTGESTAAEGMVPLCPDCRAVLAPRVYQCSQCGLNFKDENTLVRRSLLLPGGGYFYGGHAFLGMADFVVETLLSAWTLLWILVALGLPEPDLQPLEPAATPQQAILTAAIFGGILVLEKLFTIHHGRRFIRDLIPVRDPGTTARWPLYGLIAIGAIALLVWVSLPKQEVVARVAPDLIVTGAQFGLFQTDPTGNLQFSSRTTVPRQAGQRYGWVLRVKTTRPQVKWREEIARAAESRTAPAAGEQSGIVLATNEGQTTPDGGVMGSFWTVGEQDELGTYVLRVYIDSVLVRSFTFQLR